MRNSFSITSSLNYIAAISALCGSGNGYAVSRGVKATAAQCSKDVSHVSQPNFSGADDTAVFEGFCKSWSKDKEQTSIQYIAGGHVTLKYTPKKGGGDCNMPCDRSWTSISIGCGNNPNGEGNMLRTGNKDAICGVYSYEIQDEPPASVFYFGSLSGDSMTGDTGGGPGQAPTCNYVMYKDGDNICTADNVVPKDKTGAAMCGGKDNAPNFCGTSVGFGHPKGYTLKDNDDCGAAMNKQQQEDVSKAVSKGTHYADIVDVDNRNQKVGECVYDTSKTGYCTDVITTVLTEHFITCTVH